MGEILLYTASIAVTLIACAALSLFILDGMDKINQLKPMKTLQGVILASMLIFCALAVIRVVGWLNHYQSSVWAFYYQNFVLIMSLALVGGVLLFIWRIATWYTELPDEEESEKAL